VASLFRLFVEVASFDILDLRSTDDIEREAWNLNSGLSRMCFSAKTMRVGCGQTTAMIDMIENMMPQVLGRVVRA
jgi:hypothetical protein